MTTINRPTLGEPRHGSATGDAISAAGVEIGPQKPLPPLVEPEDPFEGEPSDEPLVQPTDGRLTLVPHYAMAGWSNAISECWLRAGVVQRLATACDLLPRGFGMAIFDGWRPRDLQAELFAAAAADGVADGLIAEPTRDGAHPAPHETGGAVDVALTVNGVPIAPGTHFDEMTPASATAALEHQPGVDREARRLLYWAMQESGFVVYVNEWWHFEFGTRRWAAITGHQPIYAAATPL